MQLVDIGANLTHESFRHDFADVLARAHAEGVTQLVVTGASLQGSRDALDLSQAHPGVLFATAGVHPHHASEFDAETEAGLRTLHALPEVVAVGETGLDYHRNFSPREAQLFAFERQLELAVECGKPLFLHQRDAHADFIAWLDSLLNRTAAAALAGRGALLHRREGRAVRLPRPRFLYRHHRLDLRQARGTHLRELVKSIPADRLMLETDAPYLLPRTVNPHRRTGATSRSISRISVRKSPAIAARKR